MSKEAEERMMKAFYCSCCKILKAPESFDNSNSHCCNECKNKNRNNLEDYVKNFNAAS